MIARESLMAQVRTRFRVAAASRVRSHSSMGSSRAFRLASPPSTRVNLRTRSGSLASFLGIGSSRCMPTRLARGRSCSCRCSPQRLSNGAISVVGIEWRSDLPRCGSAGGVSSQQSAVSRCCGRAAGHRPRSTRHASSSTGCSPAIISWQNISFLNRI